MNVVEVSGHSKVNSETLDNLEINEPEKLTLEQRISPEVFNIKDGFTECRHCNVGHHHKACLQPKNRSFKQ